MVSRKLAAVLAAAAISLAAADGLMHVERIPESKIVHKAVPVYPPDAQDAKIQGTVRIAVIIGADGHVQQAHIVSGHPLLTQAALQAARKYVFEPFERGGKPVRASSQLDISFSLASAQ